MTDLSGRLQAQRSEFRGRLSEVAAALEALESLLADSRAAEAEWKARCRAAMKFGGPAAAAAAAAAAVRGGAAVEDSEALSAGSVGSASVASAPEVTVAYMVRAAARREGAACVWGLGRLRSLVPLLHRPT